jgi:hypothetical protein
VAWQGELVASTLSLGEFLLEVLAIGDEYHADRLKALTLQHLLPIIDYDNVVLLYKVIQHQLINIRQRNREQLRLNN